MKILNKTLLVFCLIQTILLIFWVPAVHSQDSLNCALKLQEAQSLYNNGLIDPVPDLLTGCLSSGFTKEEELTAYKLLILTYLFEDKISQADSAMLSFLKENPEYEISPTDHTSFIYLYNKFEVKPVVQIGGHLGSNLPFLTFITPHTLAGTPGQRTYSSKATNLFFSVEAKLKLRNNIDLNIETGYSQLSFTRIEDFMGFESINYIETQRRIEIPVSLTYDFKRIGNLILYCRFGFGAGINLNISAKVSSNATDINNSDNYTGEDVDRGKDSRIHIDTFTQFGTGVKYKVPHAFVSVELRSNLGLMNQTIRGGASSEYLNSLNHYIDDDFNMNTLNLCLGYTYVFYKPIKRTE